MHLQLGTSGDAGHAQPSQPLREHLSSVRTLRHGHARPNPPQRKTRSHDDGIASARDVAPGHRRRQCRP
ncbi:hypothetical protein [Xanthomonas medicagonis]|uniref:hypothetical protein n=1 Tax=Xanthomonas medicagonis TaxID=3160841 RepID=UPI003511C753